jgi:co-chaperonin GroES (HSP10)
MAYTSLFKKDDVKITTPFSSSHKGLDLSRGVVRQPIYLPNRAVSGTVWKILPSYTKNGVEYKDAPIIYVKHKDGSGSRYIHSYPKDVKVKVGDTVVAGQQICCTGNSGHSHGDHLHFEWLTKWDDLNTRVDPAPYVMNDKEATFKVGDKVVFTGVQNIRKGGGTNYQITGETKVGDVYEIEDGPRFANGYTWYDLKGADWVADVGKFKIYEKPEIPPVSPPQPSPCEECIKQVGNTQRRKQGA